MLRITLRQAATLRDWFLPDQPGPLVGLHVLQTGIGTWRVDRWPNPRAVLVDCAGNCSLAGDPQALQPEELREQVSGFLDTTEAFVPLLRAAFPDMVVWDRVIFDLATQPQLSDTADVRLLTPEDTPHVEALHPESTWIGKTWGGLAGLAASRTAFGAFVDGHLAAVACTFFAGEQYEDIGIVTEPAFRGRGLGPACAAAVCRAIQNRGRRPSWTTAPDNIGSIRVAEKLGFTLHRRDYLYVIGITVPQPAQRQSD